MHSGNTDSNASTNVTMLDWNSIGSRYPKFRNWPKDKFPSSLLNLIAPNKPPGPEKHDGYQKGMYSMKTKCGIANQPPAFRIVGGKETDRNFYPWMVALIFNSDQFCGGTLISPRWVLTAGHCTDGADEVRLLLGAHNIRAMQEDGRKEVVSRVIIPHPEFNLMFLTNDIALVQLPEPIEFEDKIRPICLPTKSESVETLEDLDTLVTGWGIPADNVDDLSPVLREANVRTITNLECEIEFPTVVTPTNICISGEEGRATCNGDSGGPLLTVTPQGMYKQVGVTSFGSIVTCESGIPAGFTRVASYLMWIETVTGIVIED